MPHGEVDDREIRHLRLREIPVRAESGFFATTDQ